MDFNSMNWGTLSAKTNYKEKKNYDDNRFWSLAVDEQDKGQAIVRLLLDKNGVPFVNLKTIGLKAFDEVNKKWAWFISDLPVSIGEKCPLTEFREKLRKAGKDGQEEAKNFSYKNTYIGNIQVIKDPANPENEGKVFLWKFGSKLLEKFQEAMEDENKNPWNPLKEGCNVKLKRKKVAGYPNWDSSTVEEPSSFMDFEDSEEATQYLEENTYDLSEFLSPDHFDSYDEIKDKLAYFLDKYNPTSMEKDEFNEIVSEFLGKEVKASNYKSKVKKDIDMDDIEIVDDIDEDEPKSKPKVEKAESAKKEPKEEPKAEKEVKKEKPKVEDEDDIDSLLADMD